MHDDPIITLNMFIDDPNSVRYDERVKAGKATINGVSIADKAKNTALAKQIVEFRADEDRRGDQPPDRGQEAIDGIARLKTGEAGVESSADERHRPRPSLPRHAEVDRQHAAAVALLHRPR